MNVLFATLCDINSLDDGIIYTDLLREFIRNGHTVYIVSPLEKRNRKKTYILSENKCSILKVKTGNIQKTNAIEKGLSTILLEYKFELAIKKYYSNVKFDLVLYSTPPITLANVIRYVKKRDNAKTYLLLKDIFPQNAVDLGMLSENGIKGLIYKYFRKKEKKLYNISDFIGCMSPANVKYILKNNLEIRPDKVEVCPNSIEPYEIDKNPANNEQIKIKYGIPLNKTIFIYGGNIGKPQGIEFLIDCIRANENNQKSYFIIVGAGTEFSKLKYYFDSENPINAKLISQLSKNEYETLVNACDVGLIFLDKRFTIPNFPSRILSYMQASMPILAATDVNTDIGQVIESGEFGFWSKSDNEEKFNEKIQKLCDIDLIDKMGKNARKYLEKYYVVKESYDIIMKHYI
jgi:hypothetical protein